MEKTSIAKGAEITPETWDDFVDRLRHDCVGAGVERHYTADAIFIVQARRKVFGIDLDYTDKRAVICDESSWESPQEYWEAQDEFGQSTLNRIATEEHELNFLDLGYDDQWEILDGLDDHYVTGWDERWEYVCAHFTQEAADAFITRKKHDFPDGLRVYVDAQTYCWEFNAIKEAIISGRIVFQPAESGGRLK